MIRSRVEEMAVAITIEQGKPIAQSRPESSEAAKSSSEMHRKGVVPTAE